jgi:hypothetical protein
MSISGGRRDAGVEDCIPKRQTRFMNSRKIMEFCPAEGSPTTDRIERDREVSISDK